MSDQQMPQEGDDESQADNQQQTLDPAALAAELREARRDAARYRQQLKALKAQPPAADTQAVQSEAAKLQQQNQELQQQLAGLLRERQERQTREQVAAAAAKAGALYPDTLYRLAEASEIELDENGNVRNAVAVVNKLRQTYPALFRAVSVDAGSGGAGRTNDGNEINRLIRQAAGRG